MRAARSGSDGAAARDAAGLPLRASSCRASTTTITDSLRDGAPARSREAGAAATDVAGLRVPGAFEIPQAARAAAETGRFDAVVCLGCVIRGETPHFEYISSAVAHGITARRRRHRRADGVRRADDRHAGSRPRSAPVAGRDNKGWEAAAAAIEMAALFRRLARPVTRPIGLRVDERRAGRPRARGRAADAVSGGGRTRRAHEAIRTYWPARAGRARRAATMRCRKRPREFANARRRHARAVDRHRRAARRARAELASRTDGRDRSAGPAAGGLRVARPSPETPAKVIINEAIELARTFSGDEAVAFVNGVLDAVRKDLGRE